LACYYQQLSLLADGLLVSFCWYLLYWCNLHHGLQNNEPVDLTTQAKQS
jgi:hypothetical protein